MLIEFVILIEEVFEFIYGDCGIVFEGNLIVVCGE